MNPHVTVIMLGSGQRQMRDDHVQACLDDPGDEAWWHCADVLYHRHPMLADDGRGLCVAEVGDRLALELHAHPGCTVCAGWSSRSVMVIAFRRGSQVQRLHLHLAETADVADTRDARDGGWATARLAGDPVRSLEPAEIIAAAMASLIHAGLVAAARRHHRSSNHDGQHGTRRRWSTRPPRTSA